MVGDDKRTADQQDTVVNVPQARNLTDFERPSTKRLYIATSAVGTLFISVGASFAWFFGVSLYDLGDEYRAVTLSEIPWVQSLMFLGASIGTIPGDLLADRLGRKKTLLIDAITMAVGWVLIMAGNSPVICTGRFFIGLASGAILKLVTLYVAEITEVAVYASLKKLIFQMLFGGLLLEYFISLMVPYVALGVLPLLSSVAYMVAYKFIPETPMYLLKMGRIEDARTSLYWLRLKPPQEIQAELELSQVTVRKLASSWRDLVATAEVRHTILLLVGLIAGQQLSGFCIAFSATRIIFGSTESSILIVVAAIATWAIVSLSPLIMKKLIERFGRKKVFLLSGIGMAFSDMLVAIYFTCELYALLFLGIIGIMGYILSFTIGFGPLPVVYMRELLPISLLSKGGSVILTAFWYFIFILAQTFYFVSFMTTFWVFTGISAVATVYVYYFVPDDTKKTELDAQAIENHV